MSFLMREQPHGWSQLGNALMLRPCLYLIRTDMVGSAVAIRHGLQRVGLTAGREEGSPWLGFGGLGTGLIGIRRLLAQVRSTYSGYP